MNESNKIDAVYKSDNSSQNYSHTPIQISTKNLNIEINNSTDKSIFLKFFCCNYATETTLKSVADKDEKNKVTNANSDKSEKLIKHKNYFSNLYKNFLNSKYFNSVFYRNNLAFFAFIIFYLILQILLIVIQTLYYLNNNNAILVARACGILISFNMGFVLILISRRLNTWLRSSKFGQKCLPLDEFIQFHKLIGVFILILSIAHSVGHFINLCNILFILE
jgi:hypothetical protein